MTRARFGVLRLIATGTLINYFNRTILGVPAPPLPYAAIVAATGTFLYALGIAYLAVMGVLACIFVLCGVNR